MTTEQNEARDRPGLTTAMIEAGVEVLREYHWGEDDPNACVARIWAVMGQAREVARSWT